MRAGLGKEWGCVGGGLLETGVLWGLKLSGMRRELGVEGDEEAYLCSRMPFPTFMKP